MVSAPSPAAGPAAACPACGEVAGDGARFCEACGAPLVTAAPVAAPAGVGGSAAGPAPDGPASPADPAPAPPARAAAVPCPACGGEVAADGYCLECGARAPVGRDHVVERAAPHVAGVSDVGVRRRRNEDALALGVVGGTTVLVVCDGVSTAPDSDVASLAAAGAARDVLVAGVRDAPEPDAAAWSRLLVAAGHAADAAVLAAVDDAAGRADPPSCTFAAAVVAPGLLVAGWLGDSRVYWLPDDGTAEQLSDDDSVAAELVAAGLPRAQAEASPQAHAITRWLGADAPDTTARTTVTRPAGPGWALVCSDGLWNYASAPDDVGDLLRAAVERVGDDPQTLAEDLVGWANAQGGHDNTTVALARVAPRTTPPTPAAAPDDETGTVPTTRRRPAGSLAGDGAAPPSPGVAPA